jgi:hypothetical protein
MVKVFGFLTKRDHLDTQAFIDYYENNHIPMVLRTWIQSPSTTAS